MPSFRGYTGTDTSRKALAVILSIAMVLSMVPTTALAEIVQTPGATQEENHTSIPDQGLPGGPGGDSDKGQGETDQTGEDGQPEEGKANSGMSSEQLEESGSDSSVTSVGQSQPSDGENLPATRQDDETPVPEQTVTELSAESAPVTVTSSDGMDNEELLDSYVQRQLDAALPQPVLLRGRFFRAGDQLQGINHAAYEELATEVAEIAAGQRESSVVRLSFAKLKTDLGPWTAADLGVSAIVENNAITSEAIEAASARIVPDLRAVIGALLVDYPYEMYWYDKTAGTSASQLSFSASGSGSDWVLSCESTSIDLSMRVCAGYSATGAAGTTGVNTDLGQSVTTTIAKAQKIVSDNAGKPVVERLWAYVNAICGEVAYNSSAAEGGTSYGNPWQLVWVFDGDESTDVVCEGYSKAFKYLCDLTWPDGQGGPECLLATGTMSGGTGAGAHMWNVVRMDDGGSYLVDVTNCDEGTVGAPDKLFLAYGPDGSYVNGYTFHPNGHPVMYAYDDDTKALFGEEVLTISSKAYVAPTPAVKVDAPTAAEGLEYDGTVKVGVAAGEGYSLSGTPAATNAGEYVATARLSDGYAWSDGTTEAKEISWFIAKAEINPTVAIAGWRYGEAASEPSVTGNTGAGVVTYRYGRKDSPSSEYSSSVPTDAGVYVVEATIAETGNYLGKAVTSEFTISKVASSVATAPTANELTYTGESRPLVTTGVASGGTMYYSIDGGNTWSVDVPEGVDAGDYSVLYKVVGDTNHEDSSGSAVSVSIARASNGMTVPESLKASYGSSVDLSKVISDANGSVTYSISGALDGCSINENTGMFTAGTSGGVCVVTITAAGDNNHDSATKTISLVILPSIAEASISLQNPAEASVDYDGTEHTPAITVVYKGNELTSDDFDVRYLNNVNAGTATIVVTGKGGFAGTLTKSFVIAKAPSNLSASTKSTSMTATYNASAGQPLANSNINVSGSWSKVTYANVSADVTAKRFSVNSSTGVVAIPAGTMPGAYPVKVSVTDAGDANHESATKVVSYTVTITCPMSSVNVTPPAAKTYNGSAFSAAPTVKLGSTTLRSGVDYNVTYTRGGKITTDFKSAGTVCATVTGKGYYSGTKAANFVINPAKVTSAVGAARTFNGAAQTSTFTVKAGSLTVPPSSFRISGYKNNANAGTATVTITGTGNFTGSVTGSFKINPVVISAVSAANQTYTGKALTPGATVRAGSLAVPASGYSVSYKNNVNAGTATVTVTGRGNFAGSKSASFAISPAAITSVSAANQTYTGNALTPAPAVKAGSLAVPAEGFSVAYSNNTNPGTATVTVTGKGNFTGTATANFSINKPQTSWKRLAGATALDTMSAIVDEGGFATGGTVVLATSSGYWDALTAAGVAGMSGAPVLMTDPSSLSQQTASQLARLRPRKIVVCGGTAVVTEAVASAAGSAAGGADVVRLAGATAIETANEVFLRAPGVTGGKWGSVGFVCTVDGYWDALSAAPVSYARAMPIFLARPDGVEQSTIDAMRSGGVTQVYVVGGTAALPASVELQLSAAGIAVKGRLSGPTAVDTSWRVADLGVSLGMSSNNMGVATVDGYWDALSGAALCGKKGAVLVLVNGASATSISSFVQPHKNQVAIGYVFGGTAAVSDATYGSLTEATR